MFSGTGVVKIPRRDRTADQVEDQPPRRDAGNPVDVLLRLDLDDVHTDHAALVHQAVNQLARLHESDATRRGTGDRRHYRGVDTVRVDRQVVVAAVGNPLEQRVHADVVQLVRGYQLRAP